MAMKLTKEIFILILAVTFMKFWKKYLAEN